MNFGQALEQAKIGKGMRLPQWQPDVVVRAQYPDDHSKMTAPYLYVESRFDRVPWKETNIELFSNEWEVVGEQSVITGEREGAIPYTTKDLSRELSERRGVDTITVLPQKDFKIVVDGQEYEFTGPATVLINQD